MNEDTMENRSYEFLAEIYDDLMRDVDYSAWADYLMGLVLDQGDKPLNILELGCGTGNITTELLQRGYEVVGIDISEEMLEIAEEKTEDYGDKIILIEQDITALDFDIYEIDTILAANDTFNYILEKDKLQGLLAYLHPRLKTGGQLAFDISSKYKLARTLGGNTFGESFEDMAYLWENYYDPALEQVFMEINIFEKKGELYERLTESHTQKAYETEEIRTMLEEIGYRNVRIYSDFNRKEEIPEEAQRIFFSCIK